MEGDQENMEPKELSQEQTLQGTESRQRWRGALLSHRRNGLVTEVKRKSNVLVSLAGAMVILLVLLFLDPKFPIASKAHICSFTLLKTTFVFNHSVLAMQIQKWELFVLGPAFAINKMPGPVCFRMKLSSSNLSPKMDLPSLPL